MLHCDARESQGATAQLRSIEAAALSRRSASCGCEIHPAWDGAGSFVLWTWERAADGRHWMLMTHEDGAAIRFDDPSRAYAQAVKCGFSPHTVSIRWPPTVS